MMEMDDATLLKMTKTRLSILRMPELTLQKLAMKSIARNYEFFAKNPIEEQNPENLPKSLRNQVLEEFSDHLKLVQQCSTVGEMDLRVAMFKRLVNSQTMKVDLSGIINTDLWREILCMFLLELLAVLVNNAPNLEELTIDECGPRRWEHRWMTERVSRTREISYRLSQLHKLKSLKISEIVTFEDIYDLGNVCFHLPNLQVLWASVYDMPAKVPEYQHLESCFPSLIVHFIKEFDYRPRFKKLEYLLDKICCRNAERLEMVDKRKSRIFCWDTVDRINFDSITERIIYTGTPGQFRKISIEMQEGTKQDAEVGKKYNRYYEDDWEEPTDRLVPVDEENDSPEASGFNSIRFVTGGFSFSEGIQIYEPFCSPSVRTFTVEDSLKLGFRARLDMSLIAKRCPNLERLVIKDTDIMMNPALNPVNLSSLRDLDLDVPQPRIYYNKPSLSLIFSAAPNLERVRLEGTVDFFTVEGLKVVTSMIADETILRKLQKLQIVLRAVTKYDQYGDKITNKQIPEENLEQVIKFMKTASAFLPRLTEIKLATKDSREKMCFSRNSNGNFLPTDTDSIYERHSFNDFHDAYRSNLVNN